MNLITPQPTKSLLLTIDVQCDFTLPGAPAEIAGTYDAVPNMARLVEGFRAVGRPIAHMVRLYKEDGSNVDLCRREAIQKGSKIAAPGSPGAELVPALDAGPLDSQTLLRGEPQQVRINECIVYKPRWGAFYETPLMRLIDELNVNTVVVCGCNFPNCPRTSIYEASERDLRVMLVSDAISGLYDQGRRELESIGVVVAETDVCLAWLRG